VTASGAPPEPPPVATGTVDAAIAHARRLLHTNPALAADQAEEILSVIPGHPLAMLILGTAWRLSGRTADAIALLGRLAAAQPSSAATHQELGVALAAAGDLARARNELHRAVALEPDRADTWRLIGDLSMSVGDRAGADGAYARQIHASTRDPRLLAAARALCANRIPEAERLLKAHLLQYPTDVAAIRMLAEVAGRLGRYTDAENLLTRCLELAPSFDAARHNYALALHRQNKSAAALTEIARLAERDPYNHGYQNLKAVILARIGEYRESIETYAQVLAGIPDNPKLWLSYGHALASAGREEDAIAAYRRAIALEPGFGEAYWSLANLKTFRFTAAELAGMQAALARDKVGDADRFHLHFALGKAFEDAAAYATAFEHYATGNRLRRARIRYDADETATLVRRSIVQFTADYFDARRGFGDDAPDPIFIVGLPRSGSTLIEQILSSHPAVEGTMELPDIIAIAQTLGGPRRRTDESAYPAILASLKAADCRALGRQYLEQTRIQRKTGKPRFIDKMPNNFLHVGLIHQILPAAKIIDARRHPLACCFSGFKQHFARGQHFTYDLTDIGRYYRDYALLMAHFDAVLPGRIHRVEYESMIDDTEAEIRRLLDYCRLPFEASCLRFYENDRAVRTASRQQVRQPIFREGIDHWRNFEAWLGPLKQALGAALTETDSRTTIGI
jgi:predicted Zn-dependent protease